MYKSDVTLQDFIDERGVQKCAELFGVSPITIYKWRSNERRPRPDKAREIAQATQGRVTLDDIYRSAQ